ncbi:conserved hypothetical protein [Cupriavidus taiwanensis]|uniref:hypothetical protein n=1 Tax=Cupriavidus taiwanensis TaxID=164546 RepID=UPI000E12A4FE|nr:hypothetical protein [Cupriavidus taiwanensis]SOY54138.1 conserved hypothetical protein [Cupriavidus taiwanensis]
MDLFTPTLPADKLHPNFQRILDYGCEGERAVVADWADGFPDRDGKFVREFQSTFNSSFWEVYLHGLFKDYGYQMDWQHSSPDFWVKTSNHGDFIVEAVTANAAQDSTPEWEKEAIFSEAVVNMNFWPLNREAIIRLSGALRDKVLKYERTYRKLAHVPGKPFVLAVAPFEQPDFQHQYDRAIRAVLYDDYVDEQAYRQDRDKYPDGPPTVRLGSVEKDNGVTIDLGKFRSDEWPEISAVMFSCVATWGKAVAMSSKAAPGMIITTWGQGAYGKPTPRAAPIGSPSESVSDGLMVFHNPFAKHPLRPEVFRKQGVVQVFHDGSRWHNEGKDGSLLMRMTSQLIPRDMESAGAVPPDSTGQHQVSS